MESVIFILKSVVDERLINQWVSGIGAARLSAKNGFGMGRSLG